MLERFKPKAEDVIKVREEDLRATVLEMFEWCGVPAEDAQVGTDALVAADLRGVESHGVSNMLRTYITGFKERTVNARPQVRIVRESPATALVDADRGLGICTGARCMDIAIRKARECGVGVVTSFNDGHLGMIGYFAMMALKHDMVGMTMSTATRGGWVLPTFGARTRMGTNPIAVAAPTNTEVPFVLDMATSAVASNKIGLLRRTGGTIMPGLIADELGTPIMTESPVPERAALLPVGGTRELGSHKGYGLGVMVAIFAGLLSSVPVQPEAPRPPGPTGYFSHYFAAYRIDAFMDPQEFKANMDAYMRTLRETPPAPGHDRVLYPGLPEAEETEKRRREGIPLHREVVEWFRGAAAEMSLPIRF